MATAEADAKPSLNFHSLTLAANEQAKACSTKSVETSLDAANTSVRATGVAGMAALFCQRPEDLCLPIFGIRIAGRIGNIEFPWRSCGDETLFFDPHLDGGVRRVCHEATRQ